MNKKGKFYSKYKPTPFTKIKDFHQKSNQKQILSRSMEKRKKQAQIQDESSEKNPRTNSIQNKSRKSQLQKNQYINGKREKISKGKEYANTISSFEKNEENNNSQIKQKENC